MCQFREKSRKIWGVGNFKIQNKKEKQGKSRKSVPILGKIVENLVGRKKSNLKYKGKTSEIVKKCANFGKNRGKSGGTEKSKFKIQRKNK